MKEDIIFPAYISLFINDSNNMCIYYFRGLTENNNYVYQEFNEEKMPKHNKIVNEDGSIIYELESKIISINCHLISNYPNIKDKYIILKYKI